MYHITKPALMALRSAIAKRLYIHGLPAIGNTTNPSFTSPSSQKSSTATIPNSQHQLLTLPETPSSTANTEFIKRKINQSPKLSWSGLVYFPDREKLWEKLNISEMRPPADIAQFASDFGGVSVRDARKIMRRSQLQNVRSSLKLIRTNSITYSEFVTICSDACDDRDQGLEFAKLLDAAGDVLVLGNVVFLHPDQVAKSVEKVISQSVATVISQSVATPNDPRKQELEELEQKMALIDQKAISQVRCELYFGLGVIIIQTLGFMRLTFWELSWDVMEPICFFVTSFHFALAYMFFLRTSKEPTFENYFQRRFRAKQRKLMGVHKFNYEKYNELCNILYADYQGKVSRNVQHSHLGRSRRVFG